MTQLTYAALQDAVCGSAALRRVARLQPAGGEGDKVFPPTYEGGEYALENRVIGGERVPCALLDSVQSQANRMEEALLAAHRAGRLELPLVSVDFGAVGLPEVGEITSLDAPHRIADAILRDSNVGETAFRQSPAGKVLDTASVNDATGLYKYCPTALVFGVWDSTGPRGGLGAKFARALVSEVVAIDAEVGVRPSSRLDPLGIQLQAGPVFVGEGGQWTLDAKLGKKNKWKEQDPSGVNHGNVTPSLTDKDKKPHHGGVTFVRAQQSSVLSLAGLRRLHFPGPDGSADRARDEAARTVLAAIGIAAVALVTESGMDLRSRCVLVPDAEHPVEWSIVGLDGALTSFSISGDDACKLLREAVEEAAKAGVEWQTDVVRATPSEELTALVKRSRALAAGSTQEA